MFTILVTRLRNYRLSWPIKRVNSHGKLERRWYLVTGCESYVSQVLVSACSQRVVELWLLKQDKHGVVNVAKGVDLHHILQGVPVGLSQSLMEAPTAWMVRIKDKYILVAIID